MSSAILEFLEKPLADSVIFSMGFHHAQNNFTALDRDSQSDDHLIPGKAPSVHENGNDVFITEVTIA